MLQLIVIAWCVAGMVSHALCSALQELVREYLIFIAQLEHQANSAKLTLQVLFVPFHSSP